MTLSWRANSVKHLLFVFNLIFAIFGIVILSVGVTVKTYYTIYAIFLENPYFSAANLLIAIGVIILLIASFGCCGTIKHSYCMLITFSAFLILVFILLLAAGIAGYALKDRTVDAISSEMGESLSLYNGTDKPITLIWDEVQEKFRCCGAHNTSDWVHIFNETDGGLPMSCCWKITGAIGHTSCTVSSPNLWPLGCVEAFGEHVKGYAATIGSVGLGFAVILLASIVFACYLSHQFKVSYQNM